MINYPEFERQRNLLSIAEAVRTLKKMQEDVNEELQFMLFTMSAGRTLGVVSKRLDKMQARLTKRNDDGNV